MLQFPFRGWDRLLVRHACAEDDSSRLNGSASSQEKASKLGLFNSILGHVGDGNFHQMIMYNPDVAGEKQAVAACIDAMVDKTLELDGTVSASAGRAPRLHGMC